MKYIFLVITALILLTIIITGCNEKVNNDGEVATTKKHIVNTKEFIVSSNSTELVTSVKGTVFLIGEEGVPEHAKIVAWIDIDPNDWGGVVFYTPKNWHISSVMSSDPKDINEKTSEDYVTIWTNEEAKNNMIEIGTNRYYPTGGGKGAVIIELDIDKETIGTSEIFSITVGVGSDEKEGKRLIHPDYKVIEIPSS
ncbi:hypothetical protein LGQ02_05950 [Bacillus shivajii]|uniref:hypothetical protein n=1 Tax=Bacillus shivajii TaxID=1983719 RepID=UPI001CFB65A5|nr:hypothetical protein [Bacillus shivajii]UCZ54304.1 hypothetical protein LGQ02_05950 [Bacillus shivajii]